VTDTVTPGVHEFIGIVGLVDCDLFGFALLGLGNFYLQNPIFEFGFDFIRGFGIMGHQTYD